VLRGTEGVLALDVVGGEGVHVQCELALVDVFGSLRAVFVGLRVEVREEQHIRKGAGCRDGTRAPPSFSSLLRLAYSCPTSFVACVTLSLWVLFACCRWIQLVRYSCHAEGTSFGGQRTLFSGAVASQQKGRNEEKEARHTVSRAPAPIFLLLLNPSNPRDGQKPVSNTIHSN
jgi:hypothetical protein